MSTWPSAREAIAAYYRARRGPRPARPRYGEASTGTYQPTGELEATDDKTVRLGGVVIVGQVLRGRVDEGGCGIVAGSAEDREVAAWAVAEAERSPLVRRVEDRVRDVLRSEGMLATPQRFRVDRGTDEHGQTRAVVEVLAEDEETRS